jgi:von Willebrand factor A domain-containing protein 8
LDSLRKLVDEGLLQYPYSTRELVSVVKHLEQYPSEGISKALNNVFDFDSYESDIKELLLETLIKNGIPTGVVESGFKISLGVKYELAEPVVFDTWYWTGDMRDGSIAMELSFSVSELAQKGGWNLNMPAEKTPLDRIEGI